MTQHRRRRAGRAALVIGTLLSFATPAAAAPSNQQVRGSATFEDEAVADVCPDPPMGYEDFDSYAPLVMTGSLEGCWYTKVITDKLTPSGVYIETGEELFVGTLDGGEEGTFTTTYRFEAKLAPDGSEIFGRCQHPIVSGTGAFADATGIILFKDVPPTLFYYRGHIALN